MYMRYTIVTILFCGFYTIELHSDLPYRIAHGILLYHILKHYILLCHLILNDPCLYVALLESAVALVPSRVLAVNMTPDATTLL